MLQNSDFDKSEGFFSCLQIIMIVKQIGYYSVYLLSLAFTLANIREKFIVFGGLYARCSSVYSGRIILKTYQKM